MVVVTADRGVANRVDTIRAGAPVLVDEDVATLGLDTRSLGEGGVGPNTGRQDDDVGTQYGSVGECHAVLIVAVGCIILTEQE